MSRKQKDAPELYVAPHKYKRETLAARTAAWDTLDLDDLNPLAEMNIPIGVLIKSSMEREF